MFESAMFLGGGALVGFLLAPAVVRSAEGWGLVDVPSARSVHRRVVPRSGGLLLLAAFAAAWVTTAVVRVPDRSWLILGLGGFASWGIGFADDLKRMGAARKLVLQVLVAVGVVALGWRWGGLGTLGFPSLVFGSGSPVMTVLWIVAVMTVVNFLDGIDGITVACGTVWIGLGTWFGVGTHEGALYAAVLGSLYALAWWNCTPARVFPGDASTHLLGFLVAGLALEVPGADGVTLPWPLAAAPLLPAVADIGIGIVAKARHGASLGLPHRMHFYQRLVAAGLPAMHVAIRYGLLCLAAALCVGPLLWKTGMTITLCVGGLVFAAHLVDAWLRTRHLPYEFPE